MMRKKTTHTIKVSFDIVRDLTLAKCPPNPKLLLPLFANILGVKYSLNIFVPSLIGSLIESSRLVIYVASLILKVVFFVC